MKILLWSRLLLCGIAGLSHIAAAACLPAGGSRILARDLALADPQFSQLPSTLFVGFAPDPGARRIYRVAELELLARGHGIKLQNPSDICFELPLFPVRNDDAAAAMRRSLPADASLEIVEITRTEVPQGQIEFPIAGLEPAGPANPASRLWRGYVKYAETRKAAVWARVNVTMRFTAVVASKDIPLNFRISAASLRVETHSGPLARETAAVRIEDVAGRTLKRALRAGEVIPLALLTEASEVRRGDSIRVDVQCGPAHLEFQAVAENSANAGETIELRNPTSGKTFRAKLESGARAALIVPESQTL
jgi:flagella basal body P-ring formation protein FlgA